jgi:hypothetical protein
VAAGAIAPTPFVFAPAVFEFAEQQIRLSSIGARAGVVRIDRKRLLELKQCLIKAPEISQRDPEINVCAYETRLERDRLPVGNSAL